LDDWQVSIQLMRSLPVDTLYLTHFGVVEHKNEHLDTLEQRLLAWAGWMKPYAERQVAPAGVVPLFEAFVRAELLAAGIGEAGLLIYEAANPAFMSVAGLMRYWNKKLNIHG
jgi:hypothetical protein